MTITTERLEQIRLAVEHGYHDYLAEQKPHATPGKATSPVKVGPSPFLRTKALPIHVKKWVTVGGDKFDGPGHRNENHHGGTPMEIDEATGKIKKGPPGTVGKTPAQLPKHTPAAETESSSALAVSTSQTQTPSSPVTPSGPQVPKTKPSPLAPQEAKNPTKAPKQDYLSQAVTKMGMPKNASMTFGAQEKKALAKLIDAKKLETLTNDDFACMVSAIDNVKITTSVGAFDSGSSLRFDYNDDGVYAARKLMKDADGKTFMKNSEFTIGDDSPYKGEGIRFFAKQVAALKKAGVARIETYAAGQGKKVQYHDGHYNGYYTWPRFGYDGTIVDAAYNRLPKEIQTKLGTSRSVLDLYEIPGGKEAWRDYGSGIGDAVFDLTPGSRSMKVLESYLKEREAKGDLYEATTT